MQFWLYEPGQSPETGIHFPLNPQQVTIQTQVRLLTIPVLDLGEVAFPRGQSPTRISWDSILPGPIRAPGVWINRDYQAQGVDPEDVLARLHTWRHNATRLRLLATGTELLGWLVYIESLQRTISGGFGDVGYSIGFVEARPLFVFTDDEIASGQVATLLAAEVGGTPDAALAAAGVLGDYDVWSGAPGTAGAALVPGEAGATGGGTVYVSVEGDTLWTIARAFLGDGQRWEELWQANLATIGPDPNALEPGTPVVVPAGMAQVGGAVGG